MESGNSKSDMAYQDFLFTQYCKNALSLQSNSLLYSAECAFVGIPNGTISLGQ